MAITNAIMQMRRGYESDFDADKMRPGEWAVSLDTKYVRICFSPGVCVRMATYDAFETDMARIEAILEEAKTIEEVVTRINEEVSANAQAVSEYTEQALQSASSAKTSETNAKNSEINAKASETNAKVSEENAQRVFESLPKDYKELSNAFYNTAIKQTAYGESIHATDSTDNKVLEFALHGKATQNGTPAPDASIDIEISGADGSVEVKSFGENILEMTDKSSTGKGVTISVKDREVAITGMSTENASLTVGTFTCKQSGMVYVSGGVSSALCLFPWNSTLGQRPYKDETKTALQTGYQYDSNGDLSFYVEEGEDYTVTVNAPVTGTQFDNVKLYPIVYYEGFKSATNISTPNGLAGIKVSSGGNYTDASGQQWVTDEKVKYADGTGKYIKRIYKEVFDGLETTWFVSSATNPNGTVYSINLHNVNPQNLNGMSDKFTVIPNGNLTSFTKEQMVTRLNSSGVYTICFVSDKSTLEDFKSWLASNNVEFMYELAEPIITDLTASELAELDAVRTFYPTTNILNDAGCGMEVTYLADTKNYIDKIVGARLSALESALINNI